MDGVILGLIGGTGVIVACILFAVIILSVIGGI